MRQLKIIDSPSQIFTVSLDGLSMQFWFKYNTQSDRWTFDLAVGGVEIISGRKVVNNIDLLGTYNFGVGAIVCFDPEQRGNQPNRDNIPQGVVTVVHMTASEYEALLNGSI